MAKVSDFFFSKESKSEKKCFSDLFTKNPNPKEGGG